jgi:hypothetical protein
MKKYKYAHMYIKYALGKKKPPSTHASKNINYDGPSAPRDLCKLNPKDLCKLNPKPSALMPFNLWGEEFRV